MITELRVRSRSRKGFSLIELIAAISIATFVLVTIIGLFPMALQTAQMNQSETRIAFTAESILSDVFISADDQVKIPIFQKNGVLRSHVFVPQKDGHSIVLSIDAEGMVLGVSKRDYFEGDPEATYLAKISMKEKEDQPEVGEVCLFIETPGAAPMNRRKRYRFATLKRLPQSAL